MILELHLLQSFPVSNLNRDDLGQPKSATFGGVPRARISSQSLKRAAREKFTEHGLDDSDLGARTRQLVDRACTKLDKAKKDDPNAEGVVVTGLRALGLGVADTYLSKYLIFISKQAVDDFVGFCQQHWNELDDIRQDVDKEIRKHEASKTKTNKPDPSSLVAKGIKTKKLEKTVKHARETVLNATRAADIALFGRMIADNTNFNVPAASQVAHAISTHAVTTEFDYYTAVDDFKKNNDEEVDQGAGMIGTVDFNTACYYHYANLDLKQLRRNLAGDDELVAKAVQAWLGAFIHSTPGGKQSTTAARTMPETLLGTVRTRGAWNLANAFLKPITGTDLLADSTRQLFTHFQNLRGFYGDTDLRTVVGTAIGGDTAPLPVEDAVTSLDTFTSRLLSTARDTPA